MITRAPRSASWRVANGAATACSSERTVSPLRGSMSPPGIVVGSNVQPASLDQLLGDDVALDLVGALADDHQRGVAEVPLDVELGGVAVPAVDRGSRRARSPWRPRRRRAWPSRPPCRSARRRRTARRRAAVSWRAAVSLVRHVGQVVADRLVLPDRLAEALAVLGVLQRVLERRPGRPRVARAATWIRPISRPFIIWAKPWPSRAAEQRVARVRGSRRRSARSSRRPCSRAWAGPARR